MPPRKSALAAVLAVLAAAALVLAPLGWRDPEGFPARAALVPWAAGVALAVLALGVRGGWAAAGGWLALGALGHASLLGLLVAGRDVAYANLSLTADGAPRLLPLAGVALQALLVGAGVLRARRGLLDRLRELVAPWRAAALLAALGLSCFAFLPDVRSWLAKSGFLLALHVLAAANLVLAARALPAPVLARWRAALARVLGPERGAVEPLGGLGADRFALACAAGSALASALLAVAVYQRHPHVPDELVYLMHAEYLAEGRLTLPAPPVPPGFEVDLMRLDGERWYCPVPIGWPAALAAGELLGAPWLVNPLLTGLAVLLAHALLRELAERRTARLVTLLLAVSPWTLFLGMSFMPHPLALAAALLAALGIARARRREAGPRGARGPGAWPWAAGAGLGVVALIRPLEGLVWAALLGLWALLPPAAGGRRLAPRALAGLVLGAALAGGLTLPYNAALTGSATKFPIMDYVDELYGPDRNAMGFGDERGLGWGGLDPYPGHHLRDVLVNAQLNLSAIDLELLGWGLGSLAPVLWLLLADGGRGRPPGRALRTPERLALAAAGLVVLAHSFYWFSGGPDFGARYWHLSIVPLLVLAVRGLRRLGQRLDGGRGELGETRVLAAALAASALGLALHLPWRAVDRYRHYRGMRPDVRELAAEHGFGRSLVLVRGRRHPDYASAAVENGTDLERDGPVYAWDRSAEVRAALLAHYADRPVWLLDGPTAGAGRFEVVAGPLAAGEAARLPYATPGRATPGSPASGRREQP